MRGRSRQLARRVAGAVAAAAALGLGAATAACAAPPPPATVIRTVVAAAPRARHAPAAMDLRLPICANLVGGWWTGTARAVRLRARTATGHWTRQVTVDASPGEGPDAPATGERPAAAHTIAVPVWVGCADRVQLAPAIGTLGSVHLVALNTTGTATAAARTATIATRALARVVPAGRVPARAATGTAQPPIVTRAQWGADESLRRADPSYAPTLRAAVIHHTVNANSYTPAEAPALVRGIYAYHVRSNGWNDIGYNFLVDRFGTIYEGRYGGIDRNVIGAHTLGFNTATTGIAMIGTYSSVRPGSAQRTAVRHLISWRLDVAHVDPAGAATLTSAGNGVYGAGQVVHTRAVDGHRDLWSTSCPGSAAWSLIDTIRRAAWAEGGAKVANVAVTPATDVDGHAAGAHVAAHANHPVSWTVEIVGRSGQGVVATVTPPAASTTLSVDWDGTTSVGTVWAWDVDVRVRAADAAGEARAWQQHLVSVPPPVTLALARRGGSVVVGAAGSVQDPRSVRVDATLNTPARVSATILGDDHASVLATVFAARSWQAGTHPIVPLPAPAGDGLYWLRLTADDPVAGRADVVRDIAYRVDSALSWQQVTGFVSPNADHHLDALAPTLALAPLPGHVRIVATGPHVAQLVLVDEDVASSPRSVVFPPPGARVAPGRWTLTLDAARSWGTLHLAQAVVVDVAAPSVRVRRIARGVLGVRASERALAWWVTRAGGHRRVHRRWLDHGHAVRLRTGAARHLHLVDRAANTRVVRLPH